MGRHFRRELIISVAIIAGALVIFGAAFYFLAGDLQFQSKKIVDVRAAIASRVATLDSLATLKGGAAPAAGYEQAIDRILVTQDKLLDFPKWLDGLARAHKVGSSFSFQGDPVLPQGNTPGYYSFSLNISGNLNDMADFMKDVEYQSPQFLTSLYGFDISGSGDNYAVVTSGKVFFR